MLFQQMMGVRVKVPPFSEPLTLEEFFEEITYHDSSCTVDSYGKHYDLEIMETAEKVTCQRCHRRYKVTDIHHATP